MSKTVKKSRGGFSMVEVILALTIFTLMGLMFGAVFPIAVRSAHFSSNYAQAAMIAQHKLDQLRAAGYGNLEYARLKSLGIIDPAAAAPAGAGPFSYTFTNVDRLTDSGSTPGFFPAGTVGQLILTADPSAPRDLNAPANPNFNPGSSVVRATVTISWPTKGNRTASYAATGMIIQMTHR